MKKVLVLFLLIVICISIFSFTNTQIFDFYGVFEDANYTEGINVPYSPYDDYGDNYFHLTSSMSISKQYSFSQSGSYFGNFTFNRVFYIFDEYLYRFDTVENEYTRKILDSYMAQMDNGCLIYPFDLSCFQITVYLVPETYGYSVFDGTYSEFTQTSGLIPQVITYASTDFITTSDGTKDAVAKDAYDHLIMNMDLRWVPSSSDILFEVNNYGYNLGSRTFSTSFIPSNFDDVNGGKFIQSITYAIDDLGPIPPIPDSSDFDGPLEFIGGYFDWIVSEIVYIFRFLGIILKGVF